MYRSLGFAPIPVKGKRPVPSGATGREGVVTNEKIAEWSADPSWATQNIAIRNEGFIGVDVDQYGEKHGADQLRDLERRLGPLPATIKSSSRGAESESGQQFFLVPEGLEFDPQPAPDIEIVQRHHRYSVVWPSIHPDTGEQYVWYDYEGQPMANPPSIDDFERLPEAWIEHLKVERQVFHYEQHSESKVQHASEDEQRQVNAVIRDLSSLPTVWREGAGWHDIVFGSACWLSRMVNSNDYALTEEQALGILMSYTPTYPEWGQDKVMEQWVSARQSTVGQYADVPQDVIPNPLPFIDLANRLPEFTSKGEGWMELLAAEPQINTDKEYWRLRHVLLVEALRAGFTDEEAVSLVWGARASQYLQIDAFGLKKLWREVTNAQEIVGRETGAQVSPPPAEERAPLDESDARKRVDLLTPSEREEISSIQWFGSEYMDFVSSTLPTINPPFHRLNRFIILALVYAPHAQYVKEGGVVVPLNIWGIISSGSTQGKSESVEVQRTVIDAYFSPEGHPDIGGDATPEALVEKLIERDGLSSWFNSDEAHDHIERSRPGNQGYLKGLREKLTDIYGGRVPMILRNGKKDISGVNARAYLVMQYAGIDEKLYDALEPSDWESGFLHRFVWAVGEPIERTRDMKRKRLAKPGTVKTVDFKHMQKHWAAEFANNVRQISQPGEPAVLDAEDWVMDRDLEFYEFMEDLVARHPSGALLKPSVERFSWTVMKCAGLIACSFGRTNVTRTDYLLALEQAEEWLGNLLFMVKLTTQTGYRREVDRIERYIAGRPGRRAKQAAVYGQVNDVFTADKYIQQLVAEGRVGKNKDQTGETWLEIKEAA